MRLTAAEECGFPNPQEAAKRGRAGTARDLRSDPCGHRAKDAGAVTDARGRHRDPEGRPSVDARNAVSCRKAARRLQRPGHNGSILDAPR